MDSAAAGSDPRVLLGRYRIEKTLGRGGMGEILLARDQLLQRPVALKRVIPQGKGREEIRRAVLREARRASRIGDRHVMQIYDVVELPDEVMLVLEYVEGVTLRERLKEPVTLDDFWKLAPQCVAGVAAAHAHGVIHRDIKPENFMVTPTGEVKVLDFGIARRSDPGGGTTTTTTTRSDGTRGGLAGTPQYMAPEVFRGEPAEARADIFSLGVVFYELLTARRPFDGEAFSVVVSRVLSTVPPPVRELNPAVSPALSNLVQAMLAKQPAERVESTATLAKLLAEAQADPESTTLRIAGERGARSVVAAGIEPADGRREFIRTRGGAALLAVATAVAGLTMWRAVTVPALPDAINVAVLPPETPGASDDFASFALGAAEHVHAGLRRHDTEPDFQIASFADAVSAKVHTAVDARKVLGTNLALVTSMEQSPDQLRAKLELRDARNEHVIAKRTVVVPIEQPFLYLDRLDRESATILRRRARPAGAGIGMTGAGTLRFYLQAMGRARGAESAEPLLRAVEELRSACRAEPGAAVAWAGLATVQMRLRQRTGDSLWLARADTSSLVALARDSSRVEPHRARAFVFLLRKRFPQAVSEFSRAVAIDSSDADLILLFARATAGAGDRDGELRIYRREAARCSRAWQPWWWQAAWFQRSGRIDEAIGCYREMILRAPLFHQGYTDLGGDLVLRGQYAQAIDTLRVSVKLMPTQPAFDNLGAAYFNLGKLPEAAEAFNQSLQFGNADYRTWLNLGDAYHWQSGRESLATGAYMQAVRLGRERSEQRAGRSTTQDLALLSNLGVLFARLGLRDSARVYMDRAVDADSTNAEVQYRAALTLWEIDDHDTAIAALEKAVRAGFPVPWIRDSPMFRDWRDSDRFRQVVGDTLPHQVTVAS